MGATALDQVESAGRGVIDVTMELMELRYGRRLSIVTRNPLPHTPWPRGRRGGVPAWFRGSMERHKREAETSSIPSLSSPLNDEAGGPDLHEESAIRSALARGVLELDGLDHLLNALQSAHLTAFKRQQTHMSKLRDPFRSPTGRQRLEVLRVARDNDHCILVAQACDEFIRRLATECSLECDRVPSFTEVACHGGRYVLVNEKGNAARKVQN